MFKATIIGRLAADPELRVIKGNRHMLTFSVIADNGYKALAALATNRHASCLHTLEDR